MTVLRPFLPRVVEGELADARRRPLRDDLQALDHPWHDFVLEPGIQVFGVLAHDDHVDALKSRRHARQVPHRPQVGVKIERLAQSDVDAGEALARSASSTGPFSATLWRRIDSSSAGGSAWPVRSKAMTPASWRSQLDGDAGGGDDAEDRVGDFRTDAVAWNERDGM